MKKTLFLAAAAMFTWTVQAQWTDLTMEGWNADRGDFAVADIDGDGDMDIIFSATNPDAAGVENGAIWINNGKGEFTVQEGERVIKMGRSGNIDFGDIDGDGDLDVIFVGWGNGASVDARGIALNDGNGNFTLADKEKYPMTNVEKATSCGFADFNCDGLLDYFVTANWTAIEGTDDTETWEIHNIIYFQNADGTFTENPNCFPTASAYKFNESGVTIIDFNNDGAPDLWFNTNDQTKSQDRGESERLNVLFINDGTGMFTEFNLGSGIGTAAATGLKFYKSNGTASWGDIDGDGYLDMLHNGDGWLGTGENDDQVWRLYKNGNGQNISMAFDFGMQQLGRQNSINNGGYIVDWDGDGVMDLITSGWSDGWGKTQRLDLWKGDSNNPMGGFTATTFGSGVPGFSEQGMRVADLDGDGKPDLLINGYSNTGEGRKVGWIRNTSSQAAEIPGAPQNLGIYQEDGFVELSWEVPAGWNGKPGVTYNLSLYNKTTGKWMYNPMSDENGKRKVAGRMGNVFANKAYYLYDLPAGEYEWTVQAINGQYMGGAFAEKQTFTVGTSAVNMVPDELQPAFSVLDKNLTVKAQNGTEYSLKVYNVSGALVKANVFIGSITVELPEIGIYIAEVVNAQGTPYRTKVIIR